MIPPIITNSVPTPTPISGTPTPTPSATPVVTPIPRPQAFINCNGNYNSCSVTSGSSISISWTCLNSTSGIISNNLNTVTWNGLSNVQTVNNVTSAITYTLNCTGPGGSANSNVNVIIGSAATPTPVPVGNTPTPTPTPILGTTPTPTPIYSYPPQPNPSSQGVFANFNAQAVPKIMAALACYTVKFALIAVGIAMLISGIAFFFARGNPAAFTAAKKGLLYSIIGTLVIYSVYTIIVSVAAYFGVTSLPWIPLTCS